MLWYRHEVTGSQTNSQEYESDNSAHLQCLFYQWQRYRCSVAKMINIILSLYWGSVKWKFKTRRRLLVLARLLWVRISKIYRQFWYNFFNLRLEAVHFFYPFGITWRKWRRSNLFETNVKETVTFAYIITFHFPSDFSLIAILFQVLTT